MDPIEKLYIYEIAGIADVSSLNSKPEFLGCWLEAEHSYLFFSDPGKDFVDNLLNKNSNLKFISETEMDYDQWEPSDALKPFKIPPLSFVPAWMKAEDNDSMLIRINPGVVFGAGTHGTTYKCLEFLISLMDQEPIKKAIDLGTGTGILALAAAKLGAEEVIAVDNNNLAVETAVKNTELNGLKSRITCIHADARDYLEDKADLTLANLILWELENMFIPDVNYNSKWYIVSGLNRTDVERFKGQLEILPFTIVKHEMDNLWSTLVLQRIF